MADAVYVSLFVSLFFLLKLIYNKFMKKKVKTTVDVIKAVSNHADLKVESYIAKYNNDKQIENKLSLEDINEDEIYEQVMIEIEKDDKVKSTWAKALSQSEGDDKKAQSLYIKLRVDTLIQKRKEQIESKRKKIEEQEQIVKYKEKIKYEKLENEANIKIDKQKRFLRMNLIDIKEYEKEIAFIQNELNEKINQMKNIH